MTEPNATDDLVAALDPAEPSSAPNHSSAAPVPGGADSPADSGWWRLGLVLAAIIGLGLWRGWALVIVILSIVFMIFMHELGHYLTAKRGGMKVTQFFIGFGPKIWSFTRGETEFGLKAIPAGAFVKIPGMLSDEQVDPADEPRSYRQASYFNRVRMASAGSMMHFIMAFVLFWSSAVFVGQPDPSIKRVTSVFPGGSAAEAGMKVGDQIVSVDGVKLSDTADLGTVVRARAMETVPVVVEREGKRVDLTAHLGAQSAIIGTVGEDLLVFFTPTGPKYIEGSHHEVANAAGLHQMDVIRSINGVKIAEPADLTAAAKASIGGVLKVVADRGGKAVNATIDLGKDVDVSKATGQIGVSNESASVTSGPIAAVGDAGSQMWLLAKESVTGLVRAFNPVNLAGLFKRAATTSPNQSDDVVDKPTSAAQTTTQVLTENENRPLSLVGLVNIATSGAEQDWGSLLFLLAMFNMFIGLFNLVPLLPFDGGHIAVATYEKIREKLRGDGRRYFVDPARVYPIAATVVVILGLLFASTLYLDLVSPLRI